MNNFLCHISAATCTFGAIYVARDDFYHNPDSEFIGRKLIDLHLFERKFPRLANFTKLDHLRFRFGRIKKRTLP